MNPRGSRYYTYIRPIIRSKFVKTYSSLIFSLITIFIFSYYAIRPTVTTILSLQKSIGEQNKILATIREKNNNLAAGKQNLGNIPQATQTKLRNLVPDNPSLPQLINSLSYTADEAEASISGIQFQPVELENRNSEISKNAEIKQVDFIFTTQGGFEKLMNVLTNLKRLDRLVSISTINFQQSPDSELLMSVTGKAYYIKN